MRFIASFPNRGQRVRFALMIRVLRLGNSNDTFGGVAEKDRAGSVAEGILARETGEEVETIVRRIWPTDRLPELIDKWLDEYKPDLVMLKVNSYWYSHESVPLRLERKLGRFGRPFARTGKRVAEVHAVSRNLVYRRVKKFLIATIGGDTRFTPDEVVRRVEQAVRRITVHEEIGLLVVGTVGGRNRYEDLPAAAVRRKAERRDYVRSRLKEVCASLHVPLLARDVARPKADSIGRSTDGVHRNETGHLLSGTEEGEALAALWKALHPKPVSAASG